MKQSLPKFNFPKLFLVSFSENHCSNTSNRVFRDIVFPYLEKVKDEKCIPKEQYSLAIMDTFKGQDNRIIKELYHENFCEFFVVLQNLTNKVQLLDTSVNKSSKAFISKKYNSWFPKQLSAQLVL